MFSRFEIEIWCFQDLKRCMVYIVRIKFKELIIFVVANEKNKLQFSICKVMIVPMAWPSR